ncbi:MAG: DUF2513 domain-containing protein [Acidobacteria bacterium]|nr:DUF2513 domain-containing protein [Acidobacteriota bacterium]
MACRTPSAIPLRLTWEGHEFIDASRSEPVWATAMKRTGDVGGTLSLGLLKTLLDSILKSQLGL